jgi:anti-sigma factor RsiW
MAGETTMNAGELTCEQCRELLSDYLDRELSDSEVKAVERHLGDCVRCGTESSRLAGLKRIVQHWEGVKGSGEFRKAVIAQMVRESQQVPARQFADAAAAGPDTAAADDPAAEKTVPPLWVLLAAGAVAFALYWIVRWLRGV